MLLLRHDGFEGKARIHIAYKDCEAWIARVPRHSPSQGRDWQLWVRTVPGLPARTTKSQGRLAIESHLRAWLLQRYRRCLFAMRFHDLCRIAERENGALSDVGH